MQSPHDLDSPREVGDQVDLIDFRLFEQRQDGSVHEGAYGISVSRVREVAVLPDVEPVPDAHPAIIGLFHSRGEQVPVLHLSRWLRIDEAPPADTPPKVIVCEVDGHVLGLLVHQASRIRSMAWESIQPAPAMVAQQHGTTISATTRIDDDRTMLVLDIEAIVADVLGTDSAQQPQQVVASQQPVALLDRTVLVVDDSSTVRARMRRTLEGAGYTVLEAEDGEAALERLQAMQQDPAMQHPDVLITDVEMPRRSGYDLVRALRADPVWSALPIIMQSSLAGEQNEQRGRDAGCDVYLVKFDAEVLLLTVADQIDR